MISDEVWVNITENCKFSLADGDACSDAMAAYDSGYISGYNIYAPVCIDQPNGNYYPSSNVSAFISFFLLSLLCERIRGKIFLHAVVEMLFEACLVYLY